MIVMLVNERSCFSFLQIGDAEREEIKSELRDAGFNLTIDKVVTTDYFKVNLQFVWRLSTYEHQRVFGRAYCRVCTDTLIQRLES